MNQIDEAFRQSEKDRIMAMLQEVIGEAAKYLTGDDLDEAWKLAKEYWNIKTPEPLYVIFEEDVYQVAEDMGV